MRALKRTVEEVLDTARNGSRTLVRDDNTLLLFDNEFLSQDAVQLILERSPLTDICVQKCDASSSGYLVQFTLTPGSNALASAAFMYLLQCVLLVLGLHASGIFAAFLVSVP
jgi:hypothetical protein